MRQILGDRESQQDSITIRVKHDANKNVSALIAVLCDGMGGYQFGEVASEYATKQLTLEYDFEMNAKSYFQKHVKAINDDVLQIMSQLNNGARGGTTLVAVAIKENKLTYVNVGDSRLYLLRSQQLTQVTTDQVYGTQLQYEVKMNRMSQKEADEHPKREHLTNYIGKKMLSEMECYENIQLYQGDILLLCSDGVYKSINNFDFLEILTKEGTLKQKADSLIATAYSKCKGKQDNTSIAIIEVIA